MQYDNIRTALAVSVAGVYSLTGHRQDGSSYSLGKFWSDSRTCCWFASTMPSDVIHRFDSADAAHAFLLNEAGRRNLAEWA